VFDRRGGMGFVEDWCSSFFIKLIGPGLGPGFSLSDLLVRLDFFGFWGGIAGGV